MGTNEIKTVGFFLSPDCVFGAELGAVLGAGQLGFFSWHGTVL